MSGTTAREVQEEAPAGVDLARTAACFGCYSFFAALARFCTFWLSLLRKMDNSHSCCSR